MLLSHHLFALVAVAALVMPIVGCRSSQRLAVSGRVSAAGQPLESGNINFVPVAGGGSAGAPIDKGAYSIDAERGLLPGDYKVTIHAFRATGKKTWDGMGEPNAPAAQKHYVEELAQYI